ncbi:MAG: hypothetical protein ACE5HH_00765 [Candidatus Hydrothermarchaeales archaeon]
MRHITTALLIVLLLVQPAASLERIELSNNISLIITTDKPNHFILSLVNKNDFNVSPVENIQINFTYDINPSSIKAVDNYNQPVVLEEIELRFIRFTYNSTLPALGYSKIFLDVEKLQPTPTPAHTSQPEETLLPTTLPPPTPQLTPSPAPVTSPPSLVQTDAPIDTQAPSPGETVEEPEESNLQLGTIGLIILLLLALIIAALSL